MNNLLVECSKLWKQSINLMLQPYPLPHYMLYDSLAYKNTV
jgi:hypothetical protein